MRRKCLLKRVIERKINGGIEVTGRRGRRRGKLLDDHKERRILSFEGGRSRSHCVESCFGRGFGPVVRQTAE